MIIYADTSFLFGLYVSDTHSPRAVAWRRQMVEPLLISLLSELELINAVALAAFQKRVRTDDADVIYRLIEADVENDALARVDVDWTSAFARADELARTLTRSCGSRSLDVLQVAIALSLEADIFLSFDVRQRTVAMRAGLDVQPSSTPP